MEYEDYETALLADLLNDLTPNEKRLFATMLKLPAVRDLMYARYPRTARLVSGLLEKEDGHAGGD